MSHVLGVIDELSAVNQILEVVGEDPVNSLESGIPVASDARRTLSRVSREVQAKGWHVNTELEFELARDINNEIPIGPTVLRVDTAGPDAWINVVVRTVGTLRKLYDVRKKVFTFDRNLKCDVVYEFPFDELTPELQTYIAMEAAIQFQQNVLGSVSLDSLIAQRHANAWAAVQDAQAEAEDANSLRDSPHMNWTTWRSRSFGSL